MRDDGSVMVAEQSGERRDEDALFDEQRQWAQEERARRARERLEIERQAEIQRARKAGGQCIFCGRPLNAVARWFGAVRHRACGSFGE